MCVRECVFYVFIVVLALALYLQNGTFRQRLRSCCPNESQRSTAAELLSIILKSAGYELKIPHTSVDSCITFDSPLHQVGLIRCLLMQGMQSSGLYCSLLVLSTFTPELRGALLISNSLYPIPTSKSASTFVSFLHWLQAIVQSKLLLQYLCCQTDQTAAQTHSRTHTQAHTHSMNK